MMKRIVILLLALALLPMSNVSVMAKNGTVNVKKVSIR